MIMVKYLMNRKFKKIYFEIISNTRIFLNKSLVNEVTNNQDFDKLTRWLDNVEYGIFIIV